MSATALTLGAAALLVPTIFHNVAANVPITQGGWTADKEQHLSLAIAVVLIVTYLFTLVFSLYTHSDMLLADDMTGGAKEIGAELDHAGEHWSKRKALTVLLIATAFVALIAEFLVGAVEEAGKTLGLTEIFVGVVVVAIIGNAAENSSAILMAIRNKMDLTLGIALGSSLQITLFVAPVLLFASYMFGAPMNLEFTLPEVFAVMVAILIVQQISADGESNWIEGVQLLSVYAILGILFYFLPDIHSTVEKVVSHP